ncbi:hypothetical protein [uncultured Tateyamaria sp.]|uniref:hypothetical protein n=1 Tax=uncultured Tateyamaria sp. TaxID=455651 RepID=UPI0026247A1A|nr:hypothetical protein [uncultured Tateyamaria sp.]
MAALLHFPGNPRAEDVQYQRANIVGCAKAVNSLGDTLRAPMQSHCLALAIAKCEGPDSGPAQSCFDDLTLTMQRYAEQLEPLLEIEVPRDASDTLCAARYSVDTNRARCTLVAEFGHLRALFNIANAAGVTLP